MTDADLRRLERQAAMGDPQAQAKLEQARKRTEVPFNLFCENEHVAEVLRQLEEKGNRFYPELTDAGHHREAKSAGFSTSCFLRGPTPHSWYSVAEYVQVNFTRQTWHRCSARVLYNKRYELNATDDHADCQELSLWISEPCPVHQGLRHAAV